MSHRYVQRSTAQRPRPDRGERLAAIERQVRDGELTIRPITPEDVERWERERERRDRRHRPSPHDVDRGGPDGWA